MSQGHAHSLLLTLPVVRVSLSKLTSAQVQRVHLFGDEKWVLLQGTSKGFSRCLSLTINEICNFGMRQHSKMGKPQRWYRNDDWLYQLDDVH